MKARKALNEDIERHKSNKEEWNLHKPNTWMKEQTWIQNIMLECKGSNKESLKSIQGHKMKWKQRKVDVLKWDGVSQTRHRFYYSIRVYL